MSFKYQSPRHVKNLCMKIIKDRGFELEDWYEGKLGHSCNIGYMFDMDFSREIEEHNLYTLCEKLSWEIKNAENVFDVEDAIDSVEHYIRMYQLYFEGTIIPFEEGLIQRYCIKNFWA